MKIEILSEQPAMLGEGIFFDDETKDIYWLDILNSKLYRKNIINEEIPVQEFDVGDMPSSILEVSDDVITFIDRTGLCEFNIKEQVYNTILLTPYSGQSEIFRANDGVKLNNGLVLYGTMQIEPDNKKGSLICCSKENIISHIHNEIFIPNSFIEVDDKVIISDSLIGEAFVYSINNGELERKGLWSNFSSCVGTPDGGCLDMQGNIYLAFWDGHAIYKFDSDGKVLGKIELPVPRPTNCVVVGSSLYVTSAMVGLSEIELEEYPKSGHLLKVELGESK
ncbi:SMP-30/gluconolactonase/LRE family protein [Gallaecimonas xiamenensis]|uniref:Calcium binding transcriptional regulatory protein n=1 Tax=Gallaecimonas xiamenensis 3-C-1 TaxID=745411 RepID=K2IY11_9GAMM|nr:SMP-30/gluconolactonase/LRE family protein [Gallaecimonas xiamenensis]EKE75371.1 calcium binding transcriptional regulatory protein [Gallaecimonas xiamenensis 3-C-1]